MFAFIIVTILATVLFRRNFNSEPVFCDRTKCRYTIRALKELLGDWQNMSKNKLSFNYMIDLSKNIGDYCMIYRYHCTGIVNLLVQKEEMKHLQENNVYCS